MTRRSVRSWRPRSSLEAAAGRLVYVALPDKHAENDGDLRVVDESGEDYLFSSNRFVAIDVPAAVKASLLKASSMSTAA